MKSITLFVPGLLGLTEAFKHLPERDIPGLKNLQRFLSRAEKKSVNIYDWHTGLASLFQLEKLSVAELRYRQFARTTEKNIFYLCADPVYIQPDLNSAVLLAHEELDLSLDDARELAVAINTHFIDESWSLEVLSAHHWIMKLEQAAVLDTTPLARIRGQAISHALPQGVDSRYWQRMQNEIQMLLFAHPLNEKRETHGKLPVNSLWLWGEGVLPDKTMADWQSIFGQGELLDALAGWSSAERQAISIHDKLVIDKPNGKILLASDEFISIVQEQDVDAWIKVLEQLEHNWTGVLLRLLAAGELDSVVLLVGNGIQFSLNRKRLKRWWRRTKPITEIFVDG
ncbi:hypothetical protein MNBD_GAMMA24-1785 [hydrothermal vent metagenome]|uniref:Regulatory protein, RpfE type n=1 Tax=hydrothermal vent metagenome TaxID=652676 RepID=A0A3B1C291_9ZZZZ